MRAYVYGDKSLERYAGRFVWLSVNTEDKKNAAFLKRYPIPALPTILVLDASGENVALRHVGGATVPQLRKLLDDVSARSQSEADKLLAKGDRLATSGDAKNAIAAYEEALAAAPKNWSRHARASEALVVTLALAGENEQCTTKALALYPRWKGTASGANIASTGLSCAASLDEAKRGERMTALEKATRESMRVPVSADDKSGMYISLITARDVAKDEAGKRRLTEEWSAFLDASAAKAKSADQRTVFDSHRLTAYMELGTPEKAVPMLEQSRRDFPKDYNPLARLAIAYRTMKKYDKALDASTAALQLIEGPRRLTVLTARADIYAAMGDHANAKKVIEDAVAYAKSLPEGQRSERRIAALEKRLGGMK